MNDDIILPRCVVERALEALDDADTTMDYHQDVQLRRSSIEALRAALEQTQAKPVAYEYVEYRPYGAPGEIKRATILMEHYRLPDGSIAGDYEWLIQQFMCAKTTISMRPLYAGPYILEKVEQNV